MSLFLGLFPDSKNIFSVSIFSFHFPVLSISANDGDSLTFLHRHSLKAPSLADAIDPCSHHSQEGCHSKAFLAPESLLFPSTHPQPPKRGGCCTFTGRVTQQFRNTQPHGNSEIQKLLVAVWLTVSLFPLLWS